MQALSLVIQKTGSLSEIAFAQKALEFVKIKDLVVTNPKLVQEGLVFIFVRVANLIGIKEAIPDINKEDIALQIFSRFSGLSLEEINFAFKCDRFGTFGEPTQHFQLFNSEYVGKVLNRYKNWLQTTRYELKLPTTLQAPKPELNEDEKMLIIVSGVIDCFEEFQINRIIQPGKIYVYDFLFSRGVLPVHTKEFKAEIKRKAAKMTFKTVAANREERKKLSNILKAIQTGQNSQTVKCKEIILRTFFYSLIAQNKHIREIL